MKFGKRMKLSGTLLVAAGLAVVLLLSLQAHAQRRNNRNNRGDQNGNGGNGNGDYGNGGYGNGGFGGGYNNRNGNNPQTPQSLAPAPAATAPGAPTTGAAEPAPVRTFSPPVFRGRVDPLPEDYVILERKSIFNMSRRPWQDRPSGPRDDTPRVRPAAIPILRGTWQGDQGEYIAYVENPDSGMIWPFAVGDPLPGDYGEVVNITLEAMEVGKDAGPVRRIEIGQNLAGETPPASALSAPFAAGATTSSSGSSGGTATAPAGAVDTSNMSIEERMRLRRQQQLSQ